MELMNDKEFDKLIAESFERNEMLEELNRSIMKDLRRNIHRQRLRRWASIIGFSFGFPIFLVLYGYASYKIFVKYEGNIEIMCGLIITVIAMIAIAWKVAKEFSIEQE